MWNDHWALFKNISAAKTHSHHVIHCQRGRFKLMTKAHLVKKKITEPVWGFSPCICSLVISFHSDLICDDCSEGGSSKGQARGHSEACQEFQSRPFDLWLLQHSPCAAAPPRPAHLVTLPCSPVLYSEVTLRINEAHAAGEQIRCRSIWISGFYLQTINGLRYYCGIICCTQIIILPSPCTSLLYCSFAQPSSPTKTEQWHRESGGSKSHQEPDRNTW